MNRISSLVVLGLTIVGCGGRAEAERGPAGTDGQSGGSSVGGQGQVTGGSGPGGGGEGSGGGGLSEECEPLSFGCEQSNPSVTFVCGTDGSWQVADVCSGGSVCDSRDTSPSHGTCVEEQLACMGLTSGDRVCSGDTAIECAADSLAESEEPCEVQCKEGVCGQFPDDCDEQAFDCTGECDTVPTSVASCGSSGCGVLMEEPFGQLLVRAPGYAEACDSEEPGDCKEKYWSIVAPKEGAIRVTVSSDWAVVGGGDVTCAAQAGTCVVTSTFAVLSPRTSDTPARNVLVEYVEHDATCP